ncbi:MAG: type I methionyl aminopeptidase [Patescibacteria group bacterium]
MIRLKTEKDLEKLRVSGKILASVLKSLSVVAKEGVELRELDELARKLIKEAGARPAFLGYTPGGGRKPYPAAICTSVNDTIVHGIPTKYKLRKRDILKIDLGVQYEGYFTDSAVTIGIGEVSNIAKKLMLVTKEALAAGIENCRPNGHLGDIGWAVEKVVKKGGFKAINGLTGHGVGFEVHEDPTIYNFGDKGTGVKLKPGMVLAIEPMVSAGSSDIVQDNDDSYKTADGSLSAHFEHTIAITEDGIEVLTK